MGHHVAQSLPTESDTGLSAKKLMDEGTLPAYTLEEVRSLTSNLHSTHAAYMLLLALDAAVPLQLCLDLLIAYTQLQSFHHACRRIPLSFDLLLVTSQVFPCTIFHLILLHLVLQVSITTKLNKCSSVTILPNNCCILCCKSATPPS